MAKINLTVKELKAEQDALNFEIQEAINCFMKKTGQYIDEVKISQLSYNQKDGVYYCGKIDSNLKLQ